ncbi:MAG: 1-acyl-sn-glycerol-3-phosphate acyltransferase [Polyangiaceae bacterium]|nr:1-acyl-sn-glycerol-3-phosphate acyltransferase [Polyangiaceae bacterium]
MDVGRELLRAGRIVGFSSLTGSMLVGLSAHEALSRPGERDAVRDLWVRAWCRAHLALFGVEVTIDGVVPPPPREGGRLVVANHRSTADILILLRTFGGHMVSRADLARWPLVGAAARAVKTLFVQRGDAVSGAMALRSIRSTLARGATVIVFPEGTTFAKDTVQPFQLGAFLAAARAGAEVLPAGLAYATGSGAAFVNESFPAHLARMAAARPSRAALCIGSPLAPDAEPARLRDTAHATVETLVERARAIADGR